MSSVPLCFVCPEFESQKLNLVISRNWTNIFLVLLGQRFSHLALEVPGPAEFSFNLNQIKLKKLIKSLGITRKSQSGQFDQKSAGKWTSRARVENP